MVRFRCPQCRASLEHRPQRAGKMGTCDQCKAEYVEPTDPLPGMTASLWETTETSHSTASNKPKGAGSKPASPQNPKSDDEKPVPSNRRSLSKLDQFDTRELLAPLADLGLHGILVAWSPKRPGSLKVGTSSGCPKEDADRKIMELALAWIKQRSPKLYAKLLVELSKIDQDVDSAD